MKTYVFFRFGRSKNKGGKPQKTASVITSFITQFGLTAGLPSNPVVIPTLPRFDPC